jgi:hypothetical protein
MKRMGMYINVGGLLSRIGSAKVIKIGCSQVRLWRFIKTRGWYMNKVNNLITRF